MRKRTIISGAIAFVLFIGALVINNRVQGLRIYTVSYETGRWLVWASAPVAFVALVAWLVFVVFLSKDLPAIVNFADAKASSLRRWTATHLKKLEQKVRTAESAKTDMLQGAGKTTGTRSDIEQTVEPNDLSEKAPTAAFCASCGARVEPGQKFCAQCGASLN